MVLCNILALDDTLHRIDHPRYVSAKTACIFYRTLTLGDEDPLGLWIRPVAGNVPALHRNLAEAHGFQHHGKLVSVVPPQPMRPQLRLHQAPLFEDLMTHPDVLHLLDAVRHYG